MAGWHLLRAPRGRARIAPLRRAPLILRRAARAVLALAALVLPAGAARAELRSPVGGVLPLAREVAERWSWCGAWRFPVGDPRDYQALAPAGGCTYHLLRSVGRPGEPGGHQGADIGCGQGGGEVCAAAAGLVIVAEREVGTSGYGRYVVLAHRMPDGAVVYSVYAHLAEGSIPVHPGQSVAAGQRVGRVGMSGRASTPHLHFEVRVATATDGRWEKQKVRDPITFVSDRVVQACPAESLGRYLEWAQYASLTGTSPRAAEPLRAGTWWRMLAVATSGFLERLPEDPRDLADSLIAAGVIRKSQRRSPEAPLDWSELRRDLLRVRDIGARLPRRPVPTPDHREACEHWLGVRDPLAHRHEPKHGRDPAPTLGAAVLALAELAPPRDTPKAKRSRSAAAKHRRGEAVSALAADPDSTRVR